MLYSVLAIVLRLPIDHVAELTATIVCKGTGVCLTHAVVLTCYRNCFLEVHKQDSDINLLRVSSSSPIGQSC